MSSVVRVYRMSDPGAPPHPSNVRGSMAALLRACLVTGYGSGENYKAPAGWEEPFPESGNYACFRAMEGNRHFFRINDATENTDTASIDIYHAMSSPEEGTGRVVGAEDASRFIGKRASGSSANSTDWVVIADQRTCYFGLRGAQGAGGLVFHGFGELTSWVSPGPISFVAGHSNTGGLPTNNSVVGSLSALTRATSGGTIVAVPRILAVNPNDATLLPANVTSPPGEYESSPTSVKTNDVSNIFPGAGGVLAPLYARTLISSLPITLGPIRGMYQVVMPLPGGIGPYSTLERGGSQFLVVPWAAHATTSGWRGFFAIKLGEWN